MATLGKIRCDLCGFISNLETQHGRAQMNTPIGWASVYPTVRISHSVGKSKMTKQDQIAIQRTKKQILEKVSAMHICPGCLTDPERWKGDQPLQLATRYVEDEQ